MLKINKSSKHVGVRLALPFREMPSQAAETRFPALPVQCPCRRFAKSGQHQSCVATSLHTISAQLEATRIPIEHSEVVILARFYTTHFFARNIVATEMAATVTFNVGGIPFTSLRDTVLREPASRLALMIRWGPTAKP